MSAKIRISYETPEEYKYIMSNINPEMFEKLKKAKEKKGGYDRVYIDVKTKE